MHCITATCVCMTETFLTHSVDYCCFLSLQLHLSLSVIIILLVLDVAIIIVITIIIITATPAKCHYYCYHYQRLTTIKSTCPVYCKQLSNVCLLVDCLTSQQQASVSQGRICSDNFTCKQLSKQSGDAIFHEPIKAYMITKPHHNFFNGRPSATHGHLHTNRVTKLEKSIDQLTWLLQEVSDNDWKHLKC